MTRTLLVAAVLLMTGGLANADDHLFNAEQNGLAADGNAIAHTNAYTTNPAGNSGDLAPGQGSPFVGGDTKTPATDTETANEHANVKERTPK